jgi:large subunit ribosomal protein L10
MLRPEKENAVTEIAEKLSDSTGVYLADYKGLDVEEINDLRNQLREASVEFKVVKNTLARISVNNVGFEELLKYLDGPTAMAFCLADPIIGAKILSEFQKKNNKLDLKACIFDGQVYDQDRIKEIARLPGKEQILAQTVGTIAGPLRNMVNVIHALLSATVNVLDQIKKQKEN